MQIDNLQEANLIWRALDSYSAEVLGQLKDRPRLSEDRLSQLESDLNIIARIAPTLTQRIDQLNDLEKLK